MQTERTGGCCLDRRRVLGLLGGTTAGLVGFSGTVGASEDGATNDESDAADEPVYRLVQGDQCLELEPISGEKDAAAFYDWDALNTKYSSEGTTDLQQADTSLLFLYEDPDGAVSLVIVHGKLGGEHDGGAASFELHNLPADGAWTVQDDFYDATTNYDNWSTDGDHHTIDWTWAGGRTDGGVYGPLGTDFEIRIEPMFNEAAALFGEQYDGRLTDWQALSGDREDPDRFTLDMDQSLRLEVGPCEDEHEDEAETENPPPGHGGTPPGHGGDPPGHGKPPGKDEHT